MFVVSQASDVLRGDVTTWYRSLGIDNASCVSIVTGDRRLDVQCHTRDEAALLYTALSILRVGLQPVQLA